MPRAVGVDGRVAGGPRLGQAPGGAPRPRPPAGRRGALTSRRSAISRGAALGTRPIIGEERRRGREASGGAVLCSRARCSPRPTLPPRSPPARGWPSRAQYAAEHRLCWPRPCRPDEIDMTTGRQNLPRRGRARYGMGGAFLARPTTPPPPPGTPPASATCAGRRCRWWASTRNAPSQPSAWPGERRRRVQHRLRRLHLADRRSAAAGRGPGELPARDPLRRDRGPLPTPGSVHAAHRRRSGGFDVVAFGTGCGRASLGPVYGEPLAQRLRADPVGARRSDTSSRLNEFGLDGWSFNLGYLSPLEQPQRGRGLQDAFTAERQLDKSRPDRLRDRPDGELRRSPPTPTRRETSGSTSRGRTGGILLAPARHAHPLGGLHAHALVRGEDPEYFDLLPSGRSDTGPRPPVVSLVPARSGRREAGDRSSSAWASSTSSSRASRSRCARATSPTADSPRLGATRPGSTG